MPRPSFCYATCDQTRTNHHHAPHAHDALKALPKCSKKSGTSGSRAAGDADSPAGLGSSGPGASRAAKTAKRHLRYEVAFVLVYKGERDAIAAIAKAQAHARGERSHALRASALSWCSSPAPSRRARGPNRAAAAVRFRLPCAAMRAWESDANFEVPAMEQSARSLVLCTGRSGRLAVGDIGITGVDILEVTMPASCLSACGRSR